MQGTCAFNKNNSLAEVKIEDSYPNPDDYYQRVLMLHVDKHLIEVIATSYMDAAARSVTNMLHELRYLRRRGGPLVLSLCAFNGFDRSRWKCHRRKVPDTKPSHPSNPIRSIAICVGRSHVLFYRHDEGYYYVHDFFIKPLLDLLENTKVVVVGLGIKEITEKLYRQWGYRIARPVELRKLMKCAYGKDSMLWPKQDLENGGSVIDGMGLEQMTELALDGMRLEKKPAKVLEADWGDDHFYDDHTEMELLKYAGRDAFLTYEVATKCLQKSGLSWKDTSLHS